MIPLIPQDKANHYVYGTWVGLTAGVAASLFDAGVALQAAAPAAASLVAGLVKEYRDREANKKAVAGGLLPAHSVEKADIIWTAAGGLVIGLATLF